MDRPTPIAFLINMTDLCVETMSGAPHASDWDMLLFTVDFCLNSRACTYQAACLPSQLLWTLIFPIHGSPPNPL